MAKENRVTKKMMFEMVREVVAGAEVENKEDLLAFIDKEIGQVVKKNAKQSARDAERVAAGDELREMLEAVLTDDFQTLDEIIEQIEMPELTKSKMIPRLGQLIDMGIAWKDHVKTADKRKVIAYRLRSDDDQVTEE